MKKLLCALAMTAAALLPAGAAPSADYFVPYQKSDLRLPSVPLVTHDPFFSIWSNYDALNGGPTRMWCEHEKAIDGILRVDGVAYRFMGQPRQNMLVPVAGMTVDDVEWSGRVSHTKQSGTDWTKLDFDDSSWSLEQAAWGTPGEYPNVKNPWKDANSDIYVRRTVNLSADDLNEDLWVRFSHDDVFDLYVNGVLVVKTGETWRQGEEAALLPAMKAALKVGDNVIAAHCHNTTGGAYIDFGLYKDVLDVNSTAQNAVQNSVDVMATSSYYNFTCGPVDLDLVFTSPQLIDDLDLISTPINYISYQVKSTDGKKHDVQFYLATTAQLTVNEMAQPTISEKVNIDGINYLKAGSEAQNVLGRTGDLISIDWGYLYIPEINGKVAMADNMTAETSFNATGKLPEALSGQQRSTGLYSMPTLVFVNDLGSVSQAADFMMIGYDEVYDIQYMHKNYKAYYARNGKTIFDAFKEYRDNYNNTMDRCRVLDKVIYDDGLAAGNKKYAEMLAGNYRLVMAAHKLFEDEHGHLLYFSKENKSGGFVNTVDLTYPECPLYMVYNPELSKAMFMSILEYALTDERKGKNCAAHDLGIYPLANGMHYGDSMPLEESANILILADAICRITGDGSWLKPYANVLRTWANFCRQEGQNPGNQLCTDDFKGPSEQNTNLSVKAISALAAYADLLKYTGGNQRTIRQFENYAKEMALLWEADARDGDHYRMEFHRPGTWSQKYNLLWDWMWGWNLFPAEVYDREIKFYLNHQQKYGLPLDSRDLQTKSDWILWTAALAPDLETFLAFSDLQWKYINETKSRIPLSDYYMSDTGNTCNFSGRSVIAGYWSKVMMDKFKEKAPEQTAWEPKGNHIKTRWAAEVDPNAPLPEYPRPMMERKEWVNLNGLWDYSILDQNTAGSQAAFDSQILVPFAIESSLSGVMRPLEPGKALWYRKEITVPAEWEGKNVMLNFGAVDYDAKVYANGTTGRHLVGSHIGGHSAFSIDITRKITDGKVTIYVKVIDNTNEGAQPVGKQRRYPNGGGDIFYTSTSGIWQTVWMEPVEATSVKSFRTTPDIDNSTLSFDIALRGTPAGQVTVEVLDGDNTVAKKSATAAELTSLRLDIPDAKLWSPQHPNLYDVKITLADGDRVLDQIDSYAAMRKISYAKSDDGYWRMQLNNKDLFQFGPLDQGYWPDGLMTAPTDEALAYDIVKTRDWGFNMIRKHMKTEPERWYYHCDRLGMLVWQDMPASFRSQQNGWITEDWGTESNTQDVTLEKNFKAEWKEIIDQLYSYPCIVAWTPFNESWGQFKTAEIIDYTKELDSTRLINPASGGNHYKLGEGTFVDQHYYGQPIRAFERIFDPTRPYVLGEYGGLGRNIVGNRWFERNSQTYNTYTSETAITDAYVNLANQIYNIANGYVTADGNKLSYSAAVYTQTTDVETEVNGIMTYDREVVKFDEARIRKAAEKLTTLYGAEAAVELPFVDATGSPVYYNLMGVRLDRPVKGINIVVEPNGKAHKVIL